jgi:hypothetical protein
MKATQIQIPGHGLYFLVKGQLYTTPTPKPWSTPVEFAEFGRLVNGPKDQLSA